MRPTAYGLIIAAAALAGTLTGVALGLAAVPLLSRVVLRERQSVEWEVPDR